MTIKSLGNPFDGDLSLIHSRDCGCDRCQSGSATGEPELRGSRLRADVSRAARQEPEPGLRDSDDLLDRAIENAVVRSVFGHNDHSRRSFMKLMGAGTAAAALGSVFPLDKAKAAVKESLGKPEKSRLTVGFVPITCATPIIMAHPMGFYERYGLDVTVEKTAGWAVARDKSLAGEYDASHMLTPMPLAMTLGAGSIQRDYIMPAVENINGQAIVLHVEHLDKRDPKQWKGFRFGVPFEYSMHNFLLRYYLAEHGVDPDRDVQIRVVPPPEMVANLRAGNLDGYLSPDPFNQRAVWERVGFIHMLTKDIWDGHPCCAFACSQRFAREHPNSYGALLRAIIDATQYSQNPENRMEIAEAIAPRNYLNQPVQVIQQVLTGRFADGLGEVQNVPDRIDFDPFPWHSMGVWILTQMKRWGYIEEHVDYQKVAEQVYLASDARKIMEELGYPAPEENSKTHIIMGKTFDPSDPEGYINSFEIRRG